ncbi:MAG: hypothetical protein J6M62_06925, partial [Selenomonadaceae bacterium]|nr:hypothetical protein [Selenomonadaceae bacterium]
MNISFDLQLFNDSSSASDSSASGPSGASTSDDTGSGTSGGTTVTNVTVLSGVSYRPGDKTFTIGDVSLSAYVDDSNGDVTYFGFDGNSKFGLGIGTVKGNWAVPTGGIVGLNSNDSEQTVTRVRTADNGSYSWEMNSSRISYLGLGGNSDVKLYKAAKDTTLWLDKMGGQSISFESAATTNFALEVNDNNNVILNGAVAFTGGKGNVSLLGGSSVSAGAYGKYMTVSGAAGEVITIAGDSTNANTLNLKGDDAEAVVTVRGTGAVTSESVVGFKKITYDAKSTSGNTTINLDNIKNSAVSVVGGSGANNISLGSNVKGQGSVTIDGGAGKDCITLSGAGAEIVVMESVASSGDTITGWKESAGYTEKGNAISISGGIDDFFVKDIVSGTVSVGQGTLTANNDLTTITSSDATYGDKFGINITTKDGDTYSALLVNENELKSAASIKFDNYSYIIADGKQTLNLGNTNKKTVVLANTLDEKHWGDENVYKNVTAITSSSVGKSLIINGVDNASVSVVSAGKNDSIWGGNNGIADVISVKSGNDSNVFSGYNDGVDIVEKYEYGTDADKANAIRFLDGIGYVSAGKQNLTFGADENNGVEVSLNGTTSGDKVAYGFGTEGEKYVAMVDATENGKGRITYGSDVNVYIGQGDNSVVKIDSTVKEVKLGWDG